ncbi:MAG: sugar ABC transporter substrate-binding protein [Dongiaceae bacterium]
MRRQNHRIERRPAVRRALLLAAGAAFIGLAAAGGASAKDITIGWTSYPADLPVIADAIDGAKNQAQELGAKMQFALSAGAAAQANAMDNLLSLGVDVIAIDPEDSKAIGPSIKKANEAKVPIIMFIGDNLGGGTTATLISSDEEAGGYNIAKWAFEKIGGEGKVALVQGAKAHQAGLLRENGFNRALKEFPKIQVAAYGEAGWMSDKANALAADFLTKEPDLKLIIALSDGMAKGVVTAAKVAGATPVITGYNGDCETLNKVWTGQVTADLYQGWRDIGAQVVRTGVDIANGKTVPPKIIMPTFIVDKALMEKIGSGATEGTTPGLVADVKRAIGGCK